MSRAIAAERSGIGHLRVQRELVITDIQWVIRRGTVQVAKVNVKTTTVVSMYLFWNGPLHILYPHIYYILVLSAQW